MTITLLGTGTSQGVPVVACNCEVCISEDARDKRLRCSVLIETQGKTFVIDTGPDFRYQMLRAKVMHLDAVLLTHQHKDHIAGLDDVRAFNFKQKNEMCVYADFNTIQQVHTEFYYAFAQKKYPGVPEIKTIEIDEQEFDIQGVKFMPVMVMHHLLPVLGFRIGNFAYITDAKTIPQRSIDKLKNLDVLVLNALRMQSHIAHFNLDEALEMVEVLKPKRTYFTHISHLLGRHTDISKMLPDHIELAYDGLTLEL